MREVAKKIKDYMIYMEASEEEFQIIENLNKGLLKINENNIDIIQKTIMKFATGELLTAGWGQEEEKREKKKEKRNYNLDSANNFQDETIYEWKKLDECQNPKEIYYLIYKRKEK